MTGGGPSGRPLTGQGTLRVVLDGSGTLEEVWDGLGDRWGGPRRVEGKMGVLGWVGGPSGRSGMGRGTLREVQDGWRTLGEVWDGSGDPRGGL